MVPVYALADHCLLLGTRPSLHHAPANFSLQLSLRGVRKQMGRQEKMPSSRRSLGNFQSSPVPISHAFKDRFRRGKKTSQPQTSVIPIHLTGLSISRWAVRSSWARDVISPPCSTRFTFSMVFETFPRIVSFAVKNLPFQVTYMK